VVNGPGEAREADIGIAAGNGKGMIFRNGEIVRRVDEKDIVDALMEEVARWEAENAGKLPPTPDVEGLGRRKLPVIAG
jgi:(E)-4-hydroxy-3-methylbut-2-enyl-diphosphate synthase